ncbi:MAG: hypothetical protein ACR65U_07495 [Methylocystis sp.]
MNVFPNLVAQAIVFVTAVADGQEVAIFGVKHEQKPIEQNERAVAHFVQIGG